VLPDAVFFHFSYFVLCFFSLFSVWAEAFGSQSEILCVFSLKRAQLAAAVFILFFVCSYSHVNCLPPLAE
jgi:hypothetical protein